MPKTVDHDERREEILAAADALVSRGGMPRLTMREIAREVGCSLGSLSHYFADKSELVTALLSRMHRTVGARMQAAADDPGGLAAIRTVLLEAIPLDGRRHREAMVEISFWAQALGAETLMGVQQREHERFRRFLLRLLRQARRRGDLRPSLNLSLIAEDLLVFIDGVTLQATLHPTRMTPAVQRRLVRNKVDGLAAPQNNG